MADEPKGGENKPAEAPAQEPVAETPNAPKETPNAGEEKTVEQQALNEAIKSLKAAEGRIVELKRENNRLKKAGEINPESDDRIAQLEEQIGELRELITAKPSEEDKTVKELQESQRKISELSAALVHKNTVGKGTEGGNANPLEPKVEPKPLATTPQEIAILAARGFDKFGKKIK